MKEMVDQILSGEAVDIAGDGASYYLSVLLDGNKYKVGLTNPENIEDCFMRLNAKTMKEAGNLLIALADELESRTKFKLGDTCFFVEWNSGRVCPAEFDFSTTCFALLMSGNLFASRQEADKARNTVMEAYREAREGTAI